MWHVYIAKRGSKLYTGVTSDLQGRLESDKSLEVIYREEHMEQHVAYARGYEIKGWRREKKLQLAREGPGG